MPYIFVRGTLEKNGLFGNETFIDLQHVEDGNGEFVGAILSRQLGAYPVTGDSMGNGYPRKYRQDAYGQPQYFAPRTGTVETLGVARQPQVVLNTLEIHAGYKVVAANQQLPKQITFDSPTSTTRGVSYTVWTLHKPLQ